jgi:hypothetical protein
MRQAERIASARGDGRIGFPVTAVVIEVITHR